MNMNEPFSLRLKLLLLLPLLFMILFACKKNDLGLSPLYIADEVLIYKIGVAYSSWLYIEFYCEA